MLNLLGSVHGFASIVTFALVVQQMTCIFVIHLCLVNLSKQAYKPAKLLLSAFVPNQFWKSNFRDKLQMSLQIERLHTKKRFVY